MASGNKNRRILTEMNTMQREPPPGCSAGPVNPCEMDKWVAIITGPPDSPYQGGIFELEILFPPDYPFKPPKITFKTKIFHCNIYEKHLCLDILKNQWSPALTIDKVLLSIIALLQDPNPKDPLNREAAKLFESSYKDYENKAKEWVRLYASGENCDQDSEP
uniref:E2 ubiquitin-conjugating enzyme n=1 Tax=Dendroctonus ponderosae TaxID=77166 RepID=J3JVG1_DENPD|nr:unknown [Dendroctonus ponderosae]